MVAQLVHRITELSQDPELKLLKEDEVEQFLHLATQHIPLLHGLLGLIDNSDLEDVPAEIVAPLRRYIKRLFQGDADLLLVATPKLTYAILDLGPSIAELYERVKLVSGPQLPRRLFRIQVPQVEYDQALLHCTVSHEFGHPLYEEHKLERQILKEYASNLNLDSVREAYRTYLGEQGQDKDASYQETLLRQKYSKEVLTIAPTWIKELACDLIAMRMFGPAYLISFIYYISSFRLIDSFLVSHPSPRLRLKVMFRFLSQKYRSLSCAPHIMSFLVQWRSISKKRPDLQPTNVVLQIASRIVDNKKLHNIIASNVDTAVRREFRYTNSRFCHDIEKYVPFIQAHVPPVDCMTDRSDPDGGISGLLNAGWECYLEGLTGFKQRIESKDHYDLLQKYNAFLLKAMELAEISYSWKEVRDELKPLERD